MSEPHNPSALCVARRACVALVLASTALLGCPPTKVPPANPAETCTAVEGVDAQLHALLDAGKLDRAARLLASRAEACPSDAARWRDRRVEILTELGDVEAVAKLTGEPPPQRGATPTVSTARQLIEAGMAAVRHGDGPEAQRRFDRARVALLRGREPREVELIHVRALEVVDFDQDRLLVGLEEPISGSKPVGVFGRASLSPQWLLDSEHASLVPGGVATWGDHDHALRFLRQGGPPRTLAGARHLLRLPDEVAFLEPAGPKSERTRVVLYDVAADRRLAQAELGHAVDQASFASIGDARLQLESDDHVTLLRLPRLAILLDVDGYQLHWSANGQFLAVYRAAGAKSPNGPAPQDDVSVYDTRDGRLLTRTPYPMTGNEPWRRLSDDGRYLGEGLGSVRVLDVRTGRWHTYFEREWPEVQSWGTSAPIFSADGAYACSWEMGRALVAELVPGGGVGDPLCFQRRGRAIVYRVRPSPGFQHVKGLRMQVGSVHPQVLSQTLGMVAVLESQPRGAGKDAVQLQLFDVAKGKVSRAIPLGIHMLAEGAWVAIDDTRATVHVGVGDESWVFDLQGRPAKRESGDAARDEAERDVHDPFPGPSDGDPVFTVVSSSSRQESAPALPESWQTLPPFAAALGERSVAWLSNDRDKGGLLVWTAGLGWRLRRSGPTCSAAFAAGDSAIATADCDEPAHVRVQRLVDGGEATLETRSLVSGLALSADGGRLAVRHWGETAVYDVASGQQLLAVPTPPPATPEATALSPSGDRLAVLGSQTVYVYAVEPSPASRRRPQSLVARPCQGELRFVENRLLMCGEWLADLEGEQRRTLAGPLALRHVGQARSRTLSLYGEHTRAGATIELRSVPVTSRSLENGLAWVAVAGGAVLLVDRQHVQVLATLQPNGDGALAVLDEGYVDPMDTDLAASEPTNLFCRYGTELVPFQVCGERWLARGALAQILAGRRDYRQP